MGNLCEGRVCIVTGAGRGIGREHALLLASEGAKVVVNDLGSTTSGEGADAGPAGEVVEEIKGMGGEAIINGGDVSDWNQAKEMVDQAIDTWGRLDVVINNAGILRDRMLATVSEAEWDAVIKVHLKGTAAPSHHAAAYWRSETKAGNEVAGRIINTSSPSGIYGNVGQTNYGAAKAGIAAFTVIAAQELHRYGVTVNAIAPTAWTRMTADLMGGDAATDEMKEAISPRFIANVVTWLASTESSGVTGRVFDVKGKTLGIAEGWVLGPTAEQTEEPSGLGPIVGELMSKARGNSSMAGTEHEGPGFPAKSI